MSAAKTGILIGAVLALTWTIVGFWAFVFVAVAMLIGGLIGRVIDGKLAVKNLVDAFRGSRSSS